MRENELLPGPQGMRMTDADGLLSRRDLLGRGGASLLALGSGPALFAEAAKGLAAGDMSAAAKPKRGGHLRVGLNDGGPGDTLSPWNIPIYSAAARAKQVYERLFDFDHRAVPKPRLAESATPNRDATRWQVKLRSGVTFHDGRPVTADDVLYSFRYVADPRNHAASLSRLASFDLRASKRVSKLEVEFRLKRPIGDFPGLMADGQIWIVPNGARQFATRPNGTGPFIFAEWQPGIRALFKRNPNYWQHGKPYVDEVEILAIPDPVARLNALIGGQVHEVTFLSFVQAKTLLGNSSIRVLSAAQPETNPIAMWIDTPPFNDNRVREALKLAVDREAIVKKVNLGFGTVGNDLFGKGLPSYNNDLPQRMYDPEKAAALLKAAGHHGLTITLPTSNDAPGMLESATAYKEQAKAAGITINLEKLDAGSYFNNNKYLKVPLYQSNWGQSFESQAVDGLLKNAPYNETHWFSRTWAAAFERAQGISDPDRRNAAYKKLQIPLWTEGGYIIFAFFNTVDAALSKVKGIVPNISSGYANLGGFDFKDHWLES